MSSTSQKHKTFVAEPMGQKPVTALPGIGKVYGGRLADAGLPQARDVLGQHLVMKGDKESFQGWMKDQCNANVRHSGNSHEGLSEWTKEFL